MVYLSSTCINIPDLSTGAITRLFKDSSKHQVHENPFIWKNIQHEVFVWIPSWLFALD